MTGSSQQWRPKEYQHTTMQSLRDLMGLRLTGESGCKLSKVDAYPGLGTRPYIALSTHTSAGCLPALACFFPHECLPRHIRSNNTTCRETRRTHHRTSHPGLPLRPHGAPEALYLNSTSRHLLQALLERRAVQEVHSLKVGAAARRSKRGGVRDTTRLMLGSTVRKYG